MGKDRTIKIISNLIGNISAHKILVKYTNRPESINHMESEIENYRGIITDYILEFNWNSNDLEKIKKEAEKNLKNKLKESHFKDVKFPIKEIDKIINETMKNFFNTV